jgi:hypothetical protein
MPCEPSAPLSGRAELDAAAKTLRALAHIPQAESCRGRPVHAVSVVRHDEAKLFTGRHRDHDL